jgi:hypothetical protein
VKRGVAGGGGAKKHSFLGSHIIYDKTCFDNGNYFNNFLFYIE